MQKYIAQRLLLSIPTLIMISIVTFLFLRVLLPDDTTSRILVAYGTNDPALREAINEQLGLTGSKVSQYFDWVGVSYFFGGEKGVLEGDLGQSLQSRRPILQELKRRIPISFELGLWGQFAALVTAVPLGVFAAVKQDRWPDYGLRSFAIMLAAVPNFWIAILVLTFGSIWFNWAPPLHFKSLTADPIAHLKIMLAPGLIIGLTPSGGLIRLVRTQMLEVLRQDYVRTARSKGLSETTVLYKHALRNALIPVVTVVGTNLPAIIAGTIIFEQIFVLPGMGQYLILAINQLDYPVIMSLNLVFGSLLLVAVVLVDISYAFLDPRIRFT
jgi:peptide/nickel transport system permease protein